MDSLGSRRALMSQSCCETKTEIWQSITTDWIAISSLAAYLESTSRLTRTCALLSLLSHSSVKRNPMPCEDEESCTGETLVALRPSKHTASSRIHAAIGPTLISKAGHSSLHSIPASSSGTEDECTLMVVDEP
jgi:hypothetical protein